MTVAVQIASMLHTLYCRTSKKNFRVESRKSQYFDPEAMEFRLEKRLNAALQRLSMSPEQALLSLLLIFLVSIFDAVQVEELPSLTHELNRTRNWAAPRLNAIICACVSLWMILARRAGRFASPLSCQAVVPTAACAHTACQVASHVTRKRLQRFCHFPLA